jgi:hypothetical protein
MLLAGDDLTAMPQDKLPILRKLLPPVSVAARFAGQSLETGFTKLPGRTVASVFNYSDVPRTVYVRLPEPAHVRDFWTNEDLGMQKSVVEIKDVRPLSG